MGSVPPLRGRPSGSIVYVVARNEAQPDVAAAGPMLPGPAVIEQVWITLESGGFTARVWPLIFSQAIAPGEGADFSSLVQVGRRVLRVTGDIAGEAPLSGEGKANWGGVWWPRMRIEWPTWAPGVVGRGFPVPGPLGVEAVFVVRFERGLR